MHPQWTHLHDKGWCSEYKLPAASDFHIGLEFKRAKYEVKVVKRIQNGPWIKDGKKLGNNANVLN